MEIFSHQTKLIYYTLHLWFLKYDECILVSKVYNVHFYAFEKPTALSAFDDTIALPDQYKNVITAKTRYYVHQFKNNLQQAAFALDDYKKAMRQMKSNLINPQPNYMTVDRRYF